MNLIGGYYDAGDNVKFVWPMAFTVSLLSWTAIEYEKEISSVHQLGYLRRAIRWGTNFILKAHSSPTTLYTQVPLLVYMQINVSCLITSINMVNFYSLMILLS